MSRKNLETLLDPKPIPGESFYDAIARAVEQAKCGKAVLFTFNEESFRVLPCEMFDRAKERWEKQFGRPLLSNEESRAAASQQLKDMEAASEKAISDAGVMTEKQLRETDAPWPKTEEELIGYIRSLVDRPHDYGTAVYAMSLAATAAFYYAASKVGASGFQSSCADMDILRQTRGFKWGRLLNYENLLFPQYCDEEHFASARTLLNDPKVRAKLREMAGKKLSDTSTSPAHSEVSNHWRKIISDKQF